MSSPSSLQSSRGTALITGASSGIGLDFSRVFAQVGYDLVLTARNEANLDRVAAEIRERHPNRTVRVVPSDLATPGAVEDLFAAVRREEVTVDVLVNNAGFARRGAFADSDLAVDLAMLRVNVDALTALTRLFVTEMVARRAGKILNVASTAAFLPGPYMATYYATKAYVLSFSEAIAEELRGSGVTVTCLCPGATRTQFAERAGVSDLPFFSSSLSMSSERVAWFGYRAMMNGETVAIPGGVNRLSARVFPVIPRRLLTKAIHRIQRPT